MVVDARGGFGTILTRCGFLANRRREFRINWDYDKERWGYGGVRDTEFQSPPWLEKVPSMVTKVIVQQGNFFDKNPSTNYLPLYR